MTAHLFGYGDLDDYGNYFIVSAEDKEEAYEIVSKQAFADFKEELKHVKEGSMFDNNGKPHNGCAELYFKYNEDGLYNMSDDELFNFLKNTNNYNFPHIENVVDLKTNIWIGENA